MNRAAALGAAAAGLLAAGCGSNTHHAAPVRPASQRTIAAADCNYWQVSSPADRRSLLAGLRQFFGAAVPDQPADRPERGSTLTDAQATQLLDASCRAPYAGAFKLYKLYGRAAAFAPR